MFSQLKPVTWIRTSLRRQLMSGLSVFSVILLLLIGLMISSLQRVQNLEYQVVEVEGQLNRSANNVTIYLALCRQHEKDLFLNLGDQTNRGFSLIQWRGAYENLDSAIAAFRRDAITPEDQALAEQWHQQRLRYADAFLAVNQSIDDGRMRTAEDANAGLEPIQEDLRQMTTSALRTAQLKSVRVQVAGTELTSLLERAIRQVGTLGAIAALGAFAWSWLFARRLTKPVRALESATSRLTAGDLTARTDLGRDDELGRLATQFNQMASALEQHTASLQTQYHLTETARAEAEAQRMAVSAQLAHIEDQRTIIGSLSVPILPITATSIVVPLIGVLDSARLHTVRERVMQAIANQRIRHVIIDITGVDTVDEIVARELHQVIRMTNLVGSSVIVVGIRPEVAQHMVGLGVDVENLITRSSLQSGIEYVLAQNVRDQSPPAHFKGGISAHASLGRCS